MNRRKFLRTGATAGVAAGSFLAAAPAISQDRHRWRFVTLWPKGLPGLADEFQIFADFVEKASNGRLTIEIFGAGELVPALETIDAVQSGSAEMGHGAPYYWKGKVPAAQFLAGMPFGMITQEMTAWYRYGGGQAIADEVYAEMNCKVFLGGNTGVQMGGWFNKEINTPEDLAGLKIRMPGLGGEVLKAIGANVVLMPGAQTLTALQTGNIDAADWVGPFNDMAGGLYKAAKYYYYPGWHEPTTVLDLFVNQEAWAALDEELQAVVTLGAGKLNDLIFSGYIARNDQALQTLTGEHGVVLKRFPDAVLTALGKKSTEVISAIAKEDPLSEKVFNSIVAFRKGVKNWTTISTEAFLAARNLDIGEFA